MQVMLHVESILLHRIFHLLSIQGMPEGNVTQTRFSLPKKTIGIQSSASGREKISAKQRSIELNGFH